MRDKFYEKYSDSIISIIGFLTIMFGLTFPLELLEIVDGFFPEVYSYLIPLLIKFACIIGGFLFFHNRKTISWAIVVGATSYIISNIVFILSVLMKFIIIDSQSQFSYISYSSDPYMGMKIFIGILAIFFGLLSLLHNSVFVEIYKVNRKTALISILCGVLLFCLQETLIESFSGSNEFIDFQF